MRRVEPAPGQESVWDYPRPPRVEPERRRVRIVHAGVEVAASTSALRVLETSHPPGIYLPPDDITVPLARNRATSFCEWKGRAVYWDLLAGTGVLRAAAWSYPEPSPGFAEIAGYVSFYPGRLDACYLDEEQVSAQEGGFYGGWITADVVGPFKGAPGTWGW